MDSTRFEPLPENAGKPKTKIERTLEALSTRPINRFDAEEFGDHSLNSTVSTLVSQYGLVVSRVPIVVDGRFGKFRCNRYWISHENRSDAEKLLAHFRKRRGLVDQELVA